MPFKVIRGHRGRYQSKDRVRFPLPSSRLLSGDLIERQGNHLAENLAGVQDVFCKFWSVFHGTKRCLQLSRSRIEEELVGRESAEQPANQWRREQRTCQTARLQTTNDDSADAGQQVGVGARQLPVADVGGESPAVPRDALHHLHGGDPRGRRSDGRRRDRRARVRAVACLLARHLPRGQRHLRPGRRVYVLRGFGRERKGQGRITFVCPCALSMRKGGRRFYCRLSTTTGRTRRPLWRYHAGFRRRGQGTYNLGRSNSGSLTVSDAWPR